LGDQYVKINYPGNQGLLKSRGRGHGHKIHGVHGASSELLDLTNSGVIYVPNKPKYIEKENFSLRNISAATPS
jgi:hypothetical protein